MVEVLSRTEALPASYPPKPSGLSDAANALDADVIWQRLESWIAYRWRARDVTWIVRGPGEWVADLTPATVTETERWTGRAWESVELEASPLGGLELPAAGPYRIAATVGGGSVPPAGEEAYRRLAEYWAEAVERHGAGRLEIDLGGLRESFDRNPAWRARALHLSGAADLLRPYRRA